MQGKRRHTKHHVLIHLFAKCLPHEYVAQNRVMISHVRLITRSAWQRIHEKQASNTIPLFNSQIRRTYNEEYAPVQTHTHAVCASRSDTFFLHVVCETSA